MALPVLVASFPDVSLSLSRCESGGRSLLSPSCDPSRARPQFLLLQTRPLATEIEAPEEEAAVLVFFWFIINRVNKINRPSSLSLASDSSLSLADSSRSSQFFSIRVLRLHEESKLSLKN